MSKDYRDYYETIYHTPVSRTAEIFQSHDIPVKNTDHESVTPLALILYLHKRIQKLEAELKAQKTTTLLD